MHAKMVMSWRAARYAGEKPEYVVRSPWKPLISNKVGSGCCVVAKSCPTPWTVALQVPLSMGFPRQEYWSEFPFLTPGDLSDPGIQPRILHLLHWQADSLPLSHLGSPYKVERLEVETKPHWTINYRNHF